MHAYYYVHDQHHFSSLPKYYIGPVQEREENKAVTLADLLGHPSDLTIMIHPK